MSQVTAGRTLQPARTPSIRDRLARSLLGWSVLWALAVGMAAWLAATHELDELLDETLQSSSALLVTLQGHLISDEPSLTPADLPSQVASGWRGDPSLPDVAAPDEDRHYAWQVVGADGRLLARSPAAPQQAWRVTPTAGFSDAAHWRLHGRALGESGRMLYVGQSLEERGEARLEVTLSAGLAALAVGLLGHLWLRQQVRRELQPLQSFSARLSAWDGRPDSLRTDLGPVERSELEPMFAAIEDLTLRLSDRLNAEQAFASHAAHALRTPLAGIDAQLAVALKECPPPLRERLLRVRGGAVRLQAVVAALIGLFRAGTELQRQRVDVAALLARLPPAPGLQLHVAEGAALEADADLLAAALLNLIDNASRHGAGQVWIRSPDDRTVELVDDGPGVDAERRQSLQRALIQPVAEGPVGLGLRLADRVARAHGGRLLLPEVPQGFCVRLEFGPGSTA
ncbi:MAG: sensor histidine kinase N-terminal domain-containing protein [Rubrivivax sp.]|nr:sensor histidine kinase N-terminal domain-containing protein [Rubrivivax sp.]